MYVNNGMARTHDARLAIPFLPNIRKIKVDVKKKDPRTHTHSGVCLFALVSNEGQKSCLTSTLDSCVKLTLVLCASSGNSSGKNFSSLADELSELYGILIVDISYLICAEDTNFLSLACNRARRTSVFYFIHLMNPPN